MRTPTKEETGEAQKRHRFPFAEGAIKSIALTSNRPCCGKKPPNTHLSGLTGGKEEETQKRDQIHTALQRAAVTTDRAHRALTNNSWSNCNFLIPLDFAGGGKIRGKSIPDERSTLDRDWMRIATDLNFFATRNRHLIDFTSRI